jgi:hypothetical protein
MRRFVNALLFLALLTPISILGQDANSTTKTTVKKKTTVVKRKSAVEEKLEKLEQQIETQQQQIQQQSSQIQQQQSQIQQLQQGNATVEQQNAQVQASVQQASQQAAAAQQAASNLSASVADLKATTADAVQMSTADHKTVDKIVNPDTYAAKPTFIAAVAPIRPLPIDPPKKDGLVPAFRLGLVRVTPYGFIKSTVAEDSSSPRGDDFPLPGFLSADTGPNTAPEFHLKARASRFGANFEWPDISKNLVITGKFEFDWEGPFSRADNRNISAIRSNTPTIRLGYVKMDYTHGGTDWFFEAGQDWTPFASSTLPNLLETTGLGIGFGTLYERDPLMRFGFTQTVAGSFKVSPEIAIVMPAYGDLPAAVATSTGVAPVGDAGLGNQLGYGERQGADSNRPEIESRVVFQWQMDKAKGVAPAQIIFSGVESKREAIVLGSTIAAYAPQYEAAFPTGAEVSSKRWGGTAEVQLPTRWFTLIGKVYRGGDLRYFFAGELFSNFNDELGLTALKGVPSVDGASTVLIGTNAAGIAAVAPQRPVRTDGGFANLGLPLSKWFNANPAGRNAGWQAYLHWGVDQVDSRDLYRVLGPDSAGRARSRLAAATLYYKVNQWCTFAFEQSLYTTVEVPNFTTGKYLKVAGVASREWNDRREEFGPIFTF